MVDLAVRRLLEDVVNSPVKLQLLLLFTENPQLQGTSKQIAQRIYRDIWSTGEALQELSHDGILYEMGVTGEPVYRYLPRADYVEAIRRLCDIYNEPIERDTVQRLVREAATMAPYRRAAQSFEYIW